MKERNIIVLGILLAVGSLAFTSEVLACESDVDCKGDRICVQGACVDPPVDNLATVNDGAPPSAPATPAAVAPSQPSESTAPKQSEISPPQPVGSAQPPRAETSVQKPVAPQPAVPGAVPPVLGPGQSVISVNITTNKVTDADVYVDNQLVGKTPWQGVVVPGNHEVRVVPNNEYYQKTKSTKVWPQRARILEFDRFLSNNQKNWTEWFGLRGYGGYSMHQWYKNDNVHSDPDWNCEGGSHFDPDEVTEDSDCDDLVGDLGDEHVIQRSTYLAGYEMWLFTVRWPHFYWEILNGGFTWPLLVGYWGTTIGVPFHFGANEIRFGAHLTMFWGYCPTTSGLELYWVRHLARFFALEIGVRQFSYPFAIGGTLGFRI